MVDWGTVPFPPWWTARAAIRRQELDVAVERLRSVVRPSDDIVGVLVFGSYATDTVGPTSDLDVMLVTTKPAGDDPGGRYDQLFTATRIGCPV